MALGISVRTIHPRSFNESSFAVNNARQTVELRDFVDPEVFGDPFYAELIVYFAGTIATKRSQLQEAHAAGDNPALRELAHKFKGTAGGYGFLKFSELADKVQSAALSGDANQIDLHVGRLMDYLGPFATGNE